MSPLSGVQIEPPSRSLGAEVSRIDLRGDLDRETVAALRVLVPEESGLLLARLRELTQKPSFALRYHWRPGAIALWDNRAVQHFLVPDFEGDRLLHQVRVAGDFLAAVLEYEAPIDQEIPAAVSEIAPR